MEALKLTARSSDGRLFISVPLEFDNKDLEVIVLKKSIEEEQEKVKDDAMAELHRKRMEFFGKAPYPNYPTNKYDVYNQ